MDNPKVDRSGWRTVLVDRELVHHHVDMADLSETRRANEGQIAEDCGSFCFFWSGCTDEERCEAAAGFSITSYLVSKQDSLPKCHNDCYDYGKSRRSKILSYDQLDALIAAVPMSEKLLIRAETVHYT